MSGPDMSAVLLALESRRRQLRMSRADLARLSGVSLPIVRSLSRAQGVRPRLDDLAALARALGVEVSPSSVPTVATRSSIEEFRAAHARVKARYLARLVQGTMALEGDVIGPSVLSQIEEDGVRDLLSGPPSQLWGD